MLVLLVSATYCRLIFRALSACTLYECNIARADISPKRQSTNYQGNWVYGSSLSGIILGQELVYQPGKTVSL